MKPETSTKIELIEQQIAQAHSTLQSWTQQITHYQVLLENLMKQLTEIKSKITQKND